MNTPAPHRKLPFRVHIQRYKTRVVAELNGFVVELYRINRKLHPHDLEFLQELDPAWNVWVEHTLADNYTITARPGSRRWDKGRAI